MFIGEYQHSIDEKNRLALPVKFRNSLKNGFVITRGLDRCLFIFSKTEWEKLAEKLMQLPISQSNSRAFARLMLSGAMDVNLDSQGRVIVPEYLKEYAGLRKRSIIAGVYNRLEIWDEEEWQKYKLATEQNSNQIAEGMAELGI